MSYTAESQKVAAAVGPNPKQGQEPAEQELRQLGTPDWLGLGVHDHQAQALSAAGPGASQGAAVRHTCLCMGWHSSSVGWTVSAWRMCSSPCQVPAPPAAAQRAAAQPSTRRQLPPGHGPAQQPAPASAAAAATAAGRNRVLPEVLMGGKGRRCGCASAAPLWLGMRWLRCTQRCLPDRSRPKVRARTLIPVPCPLRSEGAPSGTAHLSQETAPPCPPGCIPAAVYHSSVGLRDCGAAAPGRAGVPLHTQDHA